MPYQETTAGTGYQDIPTVYSAKDEAAYEQFSIDDYGREGDQRPYQIIEPSYDAPKFLQRFSTLAAALRECKTICHLQGKPFRVVRWGRTGSGARQGGVPCKPCAARMRISRFPRTLSESGCLHGYPDAVPIAEVRPDGRHVVYQCDGTPQIVGKTNYIVSRSPFPREYNPRPVTQRYLEAVKSAQVMASRTGKRAYVCSSFGANCTKRNPKQWIPVVYVDPGGLRQRYDDVPTGTTGVVPVTPAYFKELVAESRGATYLGQGA